ncbi:nucleotidyl transferase AbiEii/AbiGii toxin family protein [Lacunimicrobium album]
MSRKKDRAISTFDIDQIKRLTVIAVVSNDRIMQKVVFKGGNALDLVYGISTRSSQDLDFSIEDEFEDIQFVERELTSSLQLVFSEKGLSVFDVKFSSVPPIMSDDMIGFWGGYKLEFKIDSSLDSRSMSLEQRRRVALRPAPNLSQVFSIDFSKHEYCGGKIIHYFDGYQLFVYSLTSIVCEKLRAICQQFPEYASLVRSHNRPRPRDFVDIHTCLMAEEISFHSQAFRTQLAATFKAKHVPLNLLERLSETRAFHAQDFRLVIDTTKPGKILLSFDEYFDFIAQQCLKLETFWYE